MKNLIKKLNLRCEFAKIFESGDLTRLRKELAEPDILPTWFDQSLEAWLHRLSGWGKITIMHKDPEAGNRKSNVTVDKFLNNIESDEMIDVFGKWDKKQVSRNQVSIFREYVDLNRKKQVEEYLITVELSAELKGLK